MRKTFLTSCLLFVLVLTTATTAAAKGVIYTASLILDTVLFVQCAVTNASDTAQTFTISIRDDLANVLQSATCTDVAPGHVCTTGNNSLGVGNAYCRVDTKKAKKALRVSFGYYQPSPGQKSLLVIQGN